VLEQGPERRNRHTTRVQLVSGGPGTPGLPAGAGHGHPPYAGLPSSPAVAGHPPQSAPTFWGHKWCQCVCPCPHPSVPAPLTHPWSLPHAVSPLLLPQPPQPPPSLTSCSLFSAPRTISSAHVSVANPGLVPRRGEGGTPGFTGLSGRVVGVRLEATGMGCGVLVGGEGLGAWALAQGGTGQGWWAQRSRPRHALTRPRASLTDQEHGLLQAGGERGAGWGQLPGGTGCRAPLTSAPAAGPRLSTAGRPWPGPG